MSIVRSALAGAAILLAGASSSAVIAADLPVKAKPPVVGASMPLDVHGNFDITYASNRVTGGGLLLYPSGTSLVQVNSGLALDVYKDPAGFVNSLTLYGGIWNEFWAEPPAGLRAWQEMDFYFGFSVGFAKDWKFSAEYVQFNFPGAIPTAYNGVFTLSYNDARWGLPIPLNPFVSLFYNARYNGAGSTVVFGERGDTYRVTIGIVPTVSLFKETLMPLTLAFPTSVTVGPSEFWNRNDGTTNFCGTTGLAPCELSNLGFYTTGIQAKWSLEKIIPKRLGSWYVKASGHYYHIANDSLLAAQTPAGVGAVGSFAGAKEDIGIGTVSTGFTF